MRKLIAAINMTLDGYCDHTLGIPDEDMHRHYADLIRNCGGILYGRITFELMTYWRDLVSNPSGNPAMDDFAQAMDRVPKIVFSRTLTSTDWDSARLAVRDLREEVIALKQEPGNDLFAGSPGLIASLTGMGLIDEWQICIHPVIAGHGKVLFRDITDQIRLNLANTRTFSSGAVILSYTPAAE